MTRCGGAGRSSAGAVFCDGDTVHDRDVNAARNILVAGLPVLPVETM
jgi:transposase